MLDKEKSISFLSNHWKEINVSIATAIVLGCILYCVYRVDSYIEKQEKLQEATIMTQDQLKDTNSVQNGLDVKKEDAKTIVLEVGKAASGETQPTTYLTVNSTSPTQAAETVKERINNNDISLPKEALEKTDRTVVAEQPENKDYQVGVYKINTYRNWGIGFGVGKVGNTTYIPIALERQYKKDRSIEMQANYSTSKSQIDGFQIVHKWHF